MDCTQQGAGLPLLTAMGVKVRTAVLLRSETEERGFLLDGTVIYTLSHEWTTFSFIFFYDPIITFSILL